MTHANGPVDRGQVTLYALSTCVWCKKTRALLEELGVAYDYEYVDLALPARADEIDRLLQGAFGRASYPALLTPRGNVQGYRPDEIKSLLGF